MTLDPRWSIFLALFIALLNYVAGVGSLLTDAGLDPGTVKQIVAVVNIVSGFLATINAVLTGIPSKNNTTGFIIKGPQEPPKP